MSVSSLNTALIRLALAVVICGAVLHSSGCGGKAPLSTLPSSLSAAEPLLGSLTKAVPGLSQAQSVLGAGSLLGLAKAKMPAEEFSQVSGAIPGTDALVDEAVKQGLPSSPTGLAAVTDFLGKSGISPSQVNQMVPTLGSALQGKVPSNVASSFMSALQ